MNNGVWLRIHVSRTPTQGICFLGHLSFSIPEAGGDRDGMMGYTLFMLKVSMCEAAVRYRYMETGDSRGGIGAGRTCRAGGNPERGLHK